MVEEALAAAPAHLAKRDIWLFTYGAMLEDPPFTPVDQVTIVCEGWRRAFCISDPKFRGDAEHPGLTLGLVAGHHCVGVAWRVLAQTAEQDLARVFAIEMQLPRYRAQWAPIRNARGHDTALVLTADTTDPDFQPHLSDAEIVGRIATSTGPHGANAEYLDKVVAALDRRGVADLYLNRLWAGVRKAAR